MEDRLGSVAELHLIEGPLAIYAPFPHPVLPKEVRKWGCNLREVSNELPIIICKPEEGP